MFDWGAKAVTDLLDAENKNIMQFSTARSKLQSRPWLIDDLDEFVQKLESYKCACVFVDNSGADIIMGIIPFVREMMACGTKVC
jgi:hypothetical protein